MERDKAKAISLLDLPETVLARILCCLDIQSKLCLTSTCSELLALGDASTEAWAVVEGVPPFLVYEDLNLSRLHSLCHWVELNDDALQHLSITVTGCCQLTPQQGVDVTDPLVDICAAATSLRSLQLHLQNLQFELCVGDWLTASPSLESLVVSGPPAVAVPSSLGQATQLRSLHLARDFEWAGELELESSDCLPTSLTSLTLQHCHNVRSLTTVEWGCLAALRRLRLLDCGRGVAPGIPQLEEVLTPLAAQLCHCKVVPLPQCLSALVQLRVLYLNDIDWSIFWRSQELGDEPTPEEQARNWADVLGPLGQLRLLSVGSCNLHTLPGVIPALTSLQVLYIQDNKFSSLPEGAWLGRLKELALDWATLFNSHSVLAAATALQRLLVGGKNWKEVEVGHGRTAEAVLGTLQCLPALRQLVSFTHHGSDAFSEGYNAYDNPRAACAEAQRVLFKAQVWCRGVEVVVRDDNSFGLSLEDIESEHGS